MIETKRILNNFYMIELKDCNTPVFTPFALNIHDTYIVNNHGAELKAKAPPSIGYVMFRIEIVTDGILGHAAYILNCGIM